MTARTPFLVGHIPPKRWVTRAECSWCGKVVRNGHSPTTHTICPECAARYSPDRRSEA